MFFRHIKINKEIIILTIFFSLLIFLFFFQIKPSSFATKPVTRGATNSAGIALDPSEEMRKWSTRIDVVGGEEMYNEFLSFYSERPYNVQHAAMHIVGAVLYKKLGIDGLVVCDSSFAFGCYHQFFTSALADFGPEVIQKLDKVCVEKFGRLGTGCQHGIGHGLVEYFGYSREALLRGLSLCSLTTVVTDYFGCSSGVFMQYNVPISFNGKEVRTELRSFDQENPIAPCNTFILEADKKSCYFSLGQWWFAMNGKSFERLGTFCALAEELYHEACYLGLGNSLIHAEGYDYRRGLSACNLMPDRSAELLCRAGASWGMFADPVFRVDAWKLCEGLSITDQEFCRQKSDLIGNQEIFGVASPV